MTDTNDTEQMNEIDRQLLKQVFGMGDERIDQLLSNQEIDLSDLENTGDNTDTAFGSENGQDQGFRAQLKQMLGLNSPPDSDIEPEIDSSSDRTESSEQSSATSASSDGTDTGSTDDIDSESVDMTEIELQAALAEIDKQAEELVAVHGQSNGASNDAVPVGQMLQQLADIKTELEQAEGDEEMWKRVKEERKQIHFALRGIREKLERKNTQLEARKRSNAEEKAKEVHEVMSDLQEMVNEKKARIQERNRRLEKEIEGLKELNREKGWDEYMDQKDEEDDEDTGDFLLS